MFSIQELPHGIRNTSRSSFALCYLSSFISITPRAGPHYNINGFTLASTEQANAWIFIHPLPWKTVLRQRGGYDEWHVWDGKQESGRKDG